MKTRIADRRRARKVECPKCKALRPRGDFPHWVVRHTTPNRSMRRGQQVKP